MVEVVEASSAVRRIAHGNVSSETSELSKLSGNLNAGADKNGQYSENENKYRLTLFLSVTTQKSGFKN
jgi:hypothetical protein